MEKFDIHKYKETTEGLEEEKKLATV